MKKIFYMCKALIPEDQRKFLFLLIFFMLIAAILEAMAIGGIAPFIAIITDPGGTPNGNGIFLSLVVHGKNAFGPRFISILALGLIIVSITKNGFLYYLVIVSNKFVFENQARLETKLYEEYLKAPYSYHLNANTADLIRNIKYEVATAMNNVMRPILATVVDCIMILAVSALLMLMAPIVTLVTFSLLCFSSCLFNWILKKRLSLYGVIRQEASSKMIRWINQGLGGIKEIKVLGRESFFVDTFNQSSKQYAFAESKFCSLSQTPRLYFETLAVTGMLFLMIAMHWYKQSASNILPLLAMLTLAGMRLMPAVNRILGNITNIRYSAPALNIVFHELESLNIEKRDKPFLLKKLPNVAKSGLHLEEVSFQYPGSKEDALKHINMSVSAHESVGIVGKTGAGKTTLINLILGLIKPTKGSICLDGMDLHQNGSKPERYAGYVPQEIYLLDDTVRRNIAYGLKDPEIDDEKVWDVLRLARLDKFIRSSPQGLDALVGERGVRISGGQKQRIGIARALYADPKLLVFDEPTSALDAETERDIALSIQEISANKMVIIVSHRHDLLDHCDRIYRIAAGKIFLEEREEAALGHFAKNHTF